MIENSQPGVCHLKVRGHSPALYKLLGQVMPGWELRKERLERLFT